MKEFFLVTSPGLEDLVALELEHWLGPISSQLEPGGVTLHLPLEKGLALNQALKLPTRLLMRVDRFRCRDFPKLYKKIRLIEWEKWVRPNGSLEVIVSSSRSRLNMKKRIESTCLKAWRDRQGENKREPDPHPIELFVRFLEDECTLSLNTSPGFLHKREGDKHVGKAPLRETLAAALLLMLEKHASPLAEVQVLDPMMGSGTFLNEALRRDQLIKQDPRHFENFLSLDHEPLAIQSSRPLIKEVFGLEQNEKAFQAAEFNLAKISSAITVQIRKGDLFKPPPLPSTPLVRWAVCNPPYGKRLAIRENLKSYYEKLFEAVEHWAQPHLFGVFLPRQGLKGKLKLPTGWRVCEKRSLTNGGLPITAYVFQSSRK